MSKYTTELRWYCEQMTGKNAYKEAIPAAIPKVFDFDFPMFDSNYRNVLCTKILKHFYTWEIGQETIGLFKMSLDTKLNEIMPYYNKMYDTTMLEFSPIMDVDYYTTNGGWRNVARTNSGTSKNTRTSKLDTESSESGTNNVTHDINTKSITADTKVSTGTESGTSVTAQDTSTDSSLDKSMQTNGNKNRSDKYSDTPQGGLQPVITGTYLTNARITDDVDSTNETGSETGSVTVKVDGDVTDNREHNTRDTQDTTVTDSGRNVDSGSSSSSSESSQTGNITDSGSTSDTGKDETTEEFVTHVCGKMGSTSYAKMIMDFRQALINVDMMIIRELEPLFMQVL